MVRVPGDNFDLRVSADEALWSVDCRDFCQFLALPETLHVCCATFSFDTLPIP
jgi:hypothetical protein